MRYNNQNNLRKGLNAMNGLSSMAILLGVSFAGELLSRALPLPVPGSIYGLVILLALLLSGALKVEKVRPAGNLLIEWMPLMFVAPSVGLMTVFDQCRSDVPALIAVCAVSTLIVMAATGWTAQALLRRSGREDRHE